ncbi:hypothetical protein N657DRAFT_663894 [Parathielavia appendiculata]|uniref:Uncharacterized protein n=1 Tax=Parathielavia appendiculata TaxID=2587402 RepID=A0AAN6Z4F3_9PEZI|nr:hypothetical protein N657DRAFT_663894 [Parathielavia appendiculata]
MGFYNPSLAIRQTDMEPNEGHTRPPTLSQSIALEDSPRIYVDQRLPSITVLLGDLPRRPVELALRLFFPPSPLQSSIGAPSSPFSNPYPTWPALPPRPRSAAGHHQGFIPPLAPLVPRRALAHCTSSTTRSYTVPDRPSAHYYRTSPDRDHHRQRRTNKRVVQATYMARWSGLNCTVSGIECYYRANDWVPATTPEGLISLVDPEPRDGAVEEEEEEEEVVDGGETEESEEEREKAKTKRPPWCKLYRDAYYRTRQVKCRQEEVSLMEQFPKELMDERNDWVREEHRVLARGFAERRRRQREEWIAARKGRLYQRMLHRRLVFCRCV